MGYILDIDTIASISSQLKKQGKKIVFTHGAFDLFHCGHLHLLNKSKPHGDILIVGIESDSNIRSYKHKLRPVILETTRAAVVAQQSAVDFVFINHVASGPNALENFEGIYRRIYQKLLVDVITHGRNFAFAEYLRNLKDIECVYIDNDLDSTTAIIKRIQEIPQN